MKDLFSEEELEQLEELEKDEWDSDFDETETDPYGDPLWPTPQQTYRNEYPGKKGTL